MEKEIDIGDIVWFDGRTGIVVAMTDDDPRSYMVSQLEDIGTRWCRLDELSTAPP